MAKIDSATIWIQMFLKGELPETFFMKCDMPQSPENHYFLILHMRMLILSHEEINAENIWNVCKNRDILVEYMQICNQIDGKNERGSNGNSRNSG